MRPYSSYEEMRRLLILLLREFSEQAVNEITTVIHDSDSMSSSDDNKCFRVNTIVLRNLWETPDAIETGFQKWLLAKYDEYDNIVKYHDINRERGNHPKECGICLHYEEASKLIR